MRSPTSSKALLSPTYLHSFREEGGNEVAEFAWILPIVLMLLLGVIWLGRAYNVYQSLTRAAAEGARVAVAHTCATCGDIAENSFEVAQVVSESLRASNIDPFPPLDGGCFCPPGSPCVVRRGVDLNNGGPTPRELGVEVSLCYPYDFRVPFIPRRWSRINITTTVQMREEN